MAGWLYTVDWQAWASFANALAIGAAAYVGANSFKRWLRQVQTERKIASAERVLTAVYKVKDGFEMIRSPLLEGWELEAAEKKLTDAGQFVGVEERRLRQATIGQLILTRLGTQGQCFKDLYECLPMARASFGIELHDALRGLLQARRNVEVAAQMYATTERIANTEDFIKGCERTMGTMPYPEIPDKVGTLIETAVSLSEKLALPVIAGDSAPSVSPDKSAKPER